MARCFNCIHFDVCDTDKRGCEESWGDCSDFLNDNDVVPRSEVEREIIDEFMSAMRVKHEENRPKYGGALALLLPDIEQIAAELKKKYTEEGG